MTPRKPNLVVCGAPLPDGGFCTRRTVPGTSCGFHPAPPLEPPPDARLRPKRCRCYRPISWTDDLGSRCLKCAGRFEPDRTVVRISTACQDKPAASVAMTERKSL
jgi:hypothetical protein